MSLPNRTENAAYVLAGGQSRRFGENKALYSLHGEPLISRSLKQLAKCFIDVSIITKDRKGYEHFGFPVLEDALPFQTPLSGIYTGLASGKTDWNFFLGCDMPFLTDGVIIRLLDAIPAAESKTEIVVPVSPQGLEPVAAFYHKSLAEEILIHQDSIYSLKGFIKSRKAVIVEFSSSKPFTNVNYKEQLAGVD